MNLKQFFIQFSCLFTIIHSSTCGMYRLPTRPTIPPAVQQSLGYDQTAPEQLPTSAQVTISPEQLRQAQEELMLENQPKPTWAAPEQVRSDIAPSSKSIGAFRPTPIYLAPTQRQRLMSKQEALKKLNLSEKDLEVSAIEDSLKNLNIDKSLLVTASALGLRNKPWVKKAINKTTSARSINAQSIEKSMEMLEAIIVLVRLDNLNHYGLDFLENILPTLLKEYVAYYSDILGNYNGPLQNPKELLDAAKNAALEVRFRQEAVRRIAMAEAREHMRITHITAKEKVENLKEQIVTQGASLFNKAKSFFTPEEKSSELIPLGQNNQPKL